MIDKQLVRDLINERLEGTDAFLVSLTISSANAIKIIIDADSGVNIERCMSVSRNVEHNLDREQEDFSLEVTSFGIGEPLQQKRQYQKNIGRPVKVLLNDAQTIIKGELHSVDDNQIKVLQTLTKKEIKEGKTPEILISFSDIKETKVEISFK